MNMPRSPQKKLYKFPTVPNSGQIEKFMSQDRELTVLIGGGGVGKVANLAEGEQVLLSRVREHLRRNIAEHQSAIVELSNFLAKLSGGVAALRTFEVKSD